MNESSSETLELNTCWIEVNSSLLKRGELYDQ
jgi:hypothetical protein